MGIFFGGGEKNCPATGRGLPRIASLSGFILAVAVEIWLWRKGVFGKRKEALRAPPVQILKHPLQKMVVFSMENCSALVYWLKPGPMISFWRGGLHGVNSKFAHVNCKVNCSLAQGQKRGPKNIPRSYIFSSHQGPVTFCVL